MFLSISLSFYISIFDTWFSVLDKGLLPLSYLLGINIVSLRPFTIFFELVEPFSLVLLVLGHSLSITLLKNAIINDLVNIATGDALGPTVQGFSKHSLARLLPSSSFSKLLSLYQRYYQFVARFRR